MSEPARTSSGYADRLLAKATRSTASERAELLEFRARMYGATSVHADGGWVKWLYDDSVAACGRGNALWTWRHEGHIEAQQGAIQTRLSVYGREYDLSWAIELMVSPAHRQRGVGAVLPTLVTRSSDMTVGTEVSEAAQKSFRRAGWVHLGKATQWVRILDAKAFLKNRVPNLSVGALSGTFNSGARALSLLDRMRTVGRELVPMERFDRRADGVWRRCQGSWPVIARRDRAWLAWRWDAWPLNDGTSAYWFKYRGETLGWVVLRHSRHHGEPAGFILDLLCRPEDVGPLLALAVRELSRRPIAAVYCLFSGPGMEQVLEVYGFVPRDSGFHLMMTAPNVPASMSATLGDPRRWFLTAGDSNLDRPRESTTYG